MCWPQIASPLIAAVSGLAGAWLGAWLALRNQRELRRQERIRTQLDEFYGPLSAMLGAIRTKERLHHQILDHTQRAWNSELNDAATPEGKRAIADHHRPDLRKAIEGGNREFEVSWLPGYRDLVEYFGRHISLAEPSTRALYSDLVEYVALWERWSSDTVGGDAAQDVQQEQLHRLQGLEKDLQDHLVRLAEDIRS